MAKNKLHRHGSHLAEIIKLLWNRNQRYGNTANIGKAMDKCWSSVRIAGPALGWRYVRDRGSWMVAYRCGEKLQPRITWPASRYQCQSGVGPPSQTAIGWVYLAVWLRNTWCIMWKRWLSTPGDARDHVASNQEDPDSSIHNDWNVITLMNSSLNLLYHLSANFSPIVLPTQLLKLALSPQRKNASPDPGLA